MERLQDHFSFLWNQSSIPYFGISSGAAIDNLYKIIYLPIYNKLEIDLSQWSLLGLSWLGTVNVVKMPPPSTYPLPISFTPYPHN